MRVPAFFVIACTMAASLAGGPARAAEKGPCREAERRYELLKGEITSVQLNSVLFQAADKGCDPLARALLAAGASVEARDRFGAMPLSHAAGSGDPPPGGLLLRKSGPNDAPQLFRPTPP